MKKMIFVFVLSLCSPIFPQVKLKTILEIVDKDTLGGFGYYAVGVTDMNNDGYSDWAVSDSHRKLTYLYYGAKIPNQIPVKTFLGGGKITSGDFNGDGWKDLALAYYFNDTVFVYYGGPSMDTIPDVILHSDQYSPEGIEGFGYNGLQVGDINGDGYDDLIVGEAEYQSDYHKEPYNMGKINLYLGSSNGLKTTPQWSVKGDSTLERLGYDVAVGDVNNDGKDDILVMSGYLEKQYYTLTVYLGRNDTLFTRNYFYDSRKILGGFKEHVDCFDIDGDGVKDILLNRIQVIKGKAQLDSLPNYYIPPPYNDSSTYGSYPRVSGGGDYNGDGRKDMLLSSGPGGGAPGVRVFFGRKDTIPQFLAYRSFPDNFLDPLNGVVCNAGDINGDGIDDIIITSSVGWPHYVGFVGIYSGDSSILTEVKPETENQPKDFELKQNYPNPFNPVTVISYQISVTSHVSLKVYDLLGKEIETLVNEEKAAGEYRVEWNAKGLASGIYICKIEAGRFKESKKMILTK
jgi:hypothetical protein